MTKQRQRQAALGLGILAAVMIFCTVFHYIRSSRPQPMILQKAVFSAPMAEAGFRLDLNTASAAELESLPGIGPTLSQRIVARREECGPFRTKEDVLAVKGIGEATYAAIEPFIQY